MAQITKLVDKYVPKIQCDTLLDIGIGSGETIKEIAPFFGNIKVFGCDNGIDKTQREMHFEDIEFDLNTYEQSKYYNQKFDLITFFDSIACWQKDEGLKILDHAVEMANKLVICWIPCGYYPYPPFKSCWHEEDFLNRGFCVYKAINIHQGPPMIASGLLAWKEVI